MSAPSPDLAAARAHLAALKAAGRTIVATLARGDATQSDVLAAVAAAHPTVPSQSVLACIRNMLGAGVLSAVNMGPRGLVLRYTGRRNA